MQVIKINKFDAESFVHPINLLLGNNLIGLELGTRIGRSAVGLVQNCQGINKLYTIDKFEPYIDYIKSIDSAPMVVDEIQSEIIRFDAKLNIKYSGHQEKIKLVEEDTEDSLLRFDDGYFDFIFFDAHLTQEKLQRDLNSWYSKCKNGGLICVHDWDCPYVQNAVNLFRHEKKIKSKFSIFDDSIIWVKE